jgi:hypothetical protein
VPNGLYACEGFVLNRLMMAELTIYHRLQDRCSSNPLVSLTFEGISYRASPVAFNFGQLTAGSSDGVGEVVAWNPWFWIVRDVFMQGMDT